ncbi:MAG: rane protein [Rhodospirillales bacterium]|jgi:membrane protein|nr:rane protein [Rhodospirillales bacterium]
MISPQLRLRRSGATLVAFTRYAVARFIADGCLTGAGALSYTSLVSLVPLTAIVLAILSAFPIFDAAREHFLEVLLQYVVPAVGEETAWWFQYFAGAAARTTAVGVIALVITAILLLATIEEQLHSIWRVRIPRTWLYRVLVYWTVLTLGPLLIGVGLSLSGYLDSLARSAGFDAQTVEQVAAAGFHRVALIVPFVLETMAGTMVYALIPNCTVRWREALVGAIVAAVAIELLKLGFGLYIARIASYQTVYGALAAIPIFLLWMYICWAAILFGAVVAAALPQWRVDRGEKNVSAGGRHLGVALALLAALAERSDSGGTSTTPELARRLGLAASTVEDHLVPLQEAGFVVAASDGGWVLARSLASTKLFDLYRVMRLPLAGSWDAGEAELPWQERIVGAMQRLAAAEADAMSVSLASLLAKPDIEDGPELLQSRRRLKP